MALNFNIPTMPEPGRQYETKTTSDVLIHGGTDPMDPAPLEALFDRFRAEIDRMANKCMGLSVKDAETSAQAAEMAAGCRKLSNRIEKKRKEVKAPYLAVTSRVDGLCRQIGQQLAQIQREAEHKNTEWLRQQEVARKVAEEKALASSDFLALPATETKIKTDSGTTKLEYEMVPVIDDLHKLPPACFAAREKQITAAVMPWIRAQIKAGFYEIAGVTITKTPVVETRVR